VIDPRVAIREGVAATRSAHMRAMRLSGGDGAWETVSLLCASEIFLRDRQMLHGLWLDDRARPIFDVYVLRDDDAFVFVGESEMDVVAHARDHLRGGAVLDDFATTHDVISLNGPFAWELLGELFGPDTIGLPYLGALRRDATWVLRAGKTGEFGYDLIVAKDETARLTARIDEVGARFDLAWAALDVVEQCMLENWFFNVRREGRASLDVTPLELQLQWRASRKRAFIGSEALAERRNRGIARRVITLVSSARMNDGDDVALDGERIGTIVNAGGARHGSVEASFVALALVDVAWAHPHVDAFTVGGLAARSVTPPLPNNRSLAINLQQHAYATRDEIAFGPLWDR